MHIHTPKPPHSWSDFLREVGIIVVGILLALGAEQIIERLHWREQVEVAEGGIKSELEYSAVHAYQRLIVQPCLQGQIRLLAQKLDEPGERWAATPALQDYGQWHSVITPVYLPPNRLWNRDYWENALASGVISHLDASRVADHSYLYAQISRMDDLQAKELAIGSRLSILGRDRLLTRIERDEILGALGELDRINGLMVLRSGQMLDHLKQAHLKYDRGAVERDRREAVQHDRAIRGSCVADLPLDLG